MSNLYSNLSVVYEAMYQSFNDYEAEYLFYSEILVKYHCKTLVEIGCGSGNLVSHFANAGFDFLGMDLSEEMLFIAKEKSPNAQFIKKDMRDFDLQTKLDAAIITGRTISHLTTNNDVVDCFKSINRSLINEGILCFDCIDATKFMPQVESGKIIIHKASHEGKHYKRESHWSKNLATGFTTDWASVYYEVAANDTLTKLGEDDTVIRSFTKEEITIFLALNGFSVKEIIDKPSYAFDTFVIVAQKID